MAQENDKNFIEIFVDIIDDLCSSLCISRNNDIKIKIKVDQRGIIEQILIKNPDNNRYITSNLQEIPVKNILEKWFEENNNEYLANNKLYEDLSYYYGRDPEWFKFNIDWVKFTYSDSVTISGYRIFL